MIFKALAGQTKEDILFGEHFPEKLTSPLSPKVQAIADGAYRVKMESEILGTGYVVKSLEAALWCFDHTDNFRDAILKAANLGNDADTTAAICGQLAGAYYGEEAIPMSWRFRLTEYTLIVQLAEKLLHSENT